jgi:flagellar basal-body rod modification protein FlgD
VLQPISTHFAVGTAIDSVAVPTAKGKIKASASPSASGTDSQDTSGTSATTIGSTFLTLLVQELQNQDPTDPVDSTAMVGQMISLNQLDQLVSINQELGTAATGVTGASGVTRGHLSGPPIAASIGTVVADGAVMRSQNVTTPGAPGLSDPNAAAFST